MLTRTLDEILKDFGASMGLDLSFDEKGVCRLELAKLAAVDIKANEDDGTLTISSVIREELPDPVTYSTILDLLALALDPAHRGGNSPVVGRDDESGFVVMYEVATPSVLCAVLDGTGAVPTPLPLSGASDMTGTPIRLKNGDGEVFTELFEDIYFYPINGFLTEFYVRDAVTGNALMLCPQFDKNMVDYGYYTKTTEKITVNASSQE